jgi:predicted ArsR family transcriptional regulator
MLASLLEGLYAIGLDQDAAWRLVSKVAFDSMPAQRRQVIALLADVDTITTKAAAIGLGLPTTTARRVFEDLAAHHLVQREEGDDGRSDAWRLTPWTRDKYRNPPFPKGQ